MKRILTVAICLSALVTSAANAQTVRDKETCAQAVEDARKAVTDGTVSEKTRKEAMQLVQISAHLCTQANFVFAENSLQIARGMVAEE